MGGTGNLVGQDCLGCLSGRQKVSAPGPAPAGRLSAPTCKNFPKSLPEPANFRRPKATGFGLGFHLGQRQQVGGAHEHGAVEGGHPQPPAAAHPHHRLPPCSSSSSSACEHTSGHSLCPEPSMCNDTEDSPGATGATLNPKTCWTRATSARSQLSQCEQHLARGSREARSTGLAGEVVGELSAQLGRVSHRVEARVVVHLQRTAPPSRLWGMRSCTQPGWVRAWEAHQTAERV